MLLTTHSAAYLKEVLRSTQPCLHLLSTSVTLLSTVLPITAQTSADRNYQPAFGQRHWLDRTHYASRACLVINHWRKAGPETFRGKEPRKPEEAAAAGTQYSQHVVAGTLATDAVLRPQHAFSGHALWAHRLVTPRGVLADPERRFYFASASS